METGSIRGVWVRCVESPVYAANNPKTHAFVLTVDFARHLFGNFKALSDL